MSWRDRTVEEAVVGDRHPFGAATVTDPYDAPRVDMAGERAAGDRTCFRLIDKRVGVAECRGRGVLRTRLRVVVVAHHHVAIGGQVISDMVVPPEIMAVATADDDEGQSAHCGNVGRKVEVFAELVARNAEVRGDGGVKVVNLFGDGVRPCHCGVGYHIEPGFAA